MDPPKRGQGRGLHNWLYFPAAHNLLWHFDEDTEELIDFLVELTGADERETRDAVENCYANGEYWRPDGNGGGRRRRQRQRATTSATPPAERAPRPPRKPEWPEPDVGRIGRIVASGGGLAELHRKSDYRIWDSPERFTGWILSQLYAEDDLLCMACTGRQFVTATLAEWRESQTQDDGRITPLHKLSLIVPNPPFQVWGRTKLERKRSQHALESWSLPRRFQGVEFDSGSADDHASLLWHLNDTLPLIVATHSGNKSLHGIYDCRDRSEEEVRSFFEEAMRLRCDKALWSLSQFCRLPDGSRADTRARQLVHFFKTPNKPL
jgi:hypothetical protein